MPQLRQNIITGDWVVIAPERARRPSDFTVERDVRTDVQDSCVFCMHGRVYQEERLKEFETDLVYTVPNKYPVFIEDPAICSPRSFPVEGSFYTARPSTGGHDVLVVKDHETSLPGFSIATWADLMELSRKRVEYFYAGCNAVSAMPIYNHRHEAGASVYHPHAQLVAANVVPNVISREMHRTEQYFEDKGICAFCALIHHERKMDIRIIYESEVFIAFTFYAARFPFEVWLLPKRHNAKFEVISQDEVLELGRAMKAVTGQLDAALKDPPLNYFIHTLPATVDNADYYHWHLEITPRLSNYGGYELGSGVVVDVMSPEVAASYLVQHKAAKGYEPDGVIDA